MLRFVSTPMRLICAVAAALVLAPAAYAQEASLKRADSYFDLEDYHTAATQYEQLLKENPQSGIAKFKAGVCYLYTGRAEEGLAYIRDARQLPLEIDPYYYFWLGKAYHLNMRIDSALVNYRRYLNTAPASDAFRKGTENLIAQAHRTESYFLAPDASPLQARNLGENINSPYTERNPLVTADGHLMVFSSRRPLYPEEQPQPDGEYVEKSFISAVQPDGSWGKALPLLAPADRKSWYTAVQLLEGGQKILLLQESGAGGFYIATRQGDAFYINAQKGEGYADPKKLDLGLKVSTTGYDVSLSGDLKSAVYSKLNRTTGDLDLYFTHKQGDGSWTKPLRISSAVNTLENEVSPLLSADGKTLTFASKGREGLGGFDLFRSKFDEAAARWAPAENMGMPYNSPGNDINYTELSVDGKKMGYLCASRPRGYGEADIYEIDFAGARAAK